VLPKRGNERTRSVILQAWDELRPVITWAQAGLPVLLEANSPTWRWPLQNAFQ